MILETKPFFSNFLRNFFQFLLLTKGRGWGQVEKFGGQVVITSWKLDNIALICHIFGNYEVWPVSWATKDLKITHTGDTESLDQYI